MKFILPIPPSDNERFIISHRNMRLINTSKFRQYKYYARIMLCKQLRENTVDSLDFKLSNFPLELSYEYQYPVILNVFPKDKRRDMTNIQKCLFDCMTGIIFSDDKWILPRYERIIIDAENPRVEVTI